jgi:hypothetical protein
MRVGPKLLSFFYITFLFVHPVLSCSQNAVTIDNESSKAALPPGYAFPRERIKFPNSYFIAGDLY